MTGLTSEEKIMVLKKMVAFLKTNKRNTGHGVLGAYFGLCTAFAYSSRGIVEVSVSMLGAIPELLRYKPAINEDHAYWFDRNDFTLRIRICEDVISEIEKTLI